MIKILKQNKDRKFYEVHNPTDKGALLWQGWRPDVSIMIPPQSTFQSDPHIYCIGNIYASRKGLKVTEILSL